MRINENVNLPSVPESNYDRSLQQALAPVLRDIAIKVNQIADGKLAAYDGARSAVPTTGTWQQGDRIRNTTPTELGGAGNKYTVLGWICTASGTPGTWLQVRALTGN